MREATLKRCRRCQATDREADWECRTCESMCCEHLCANKDDTHGHYEATCFACRMDEKSAKKAT